MLPAAVSTACTLRCQFILFDSRTYECNEHKLTFAGIHDTHQPSGCDKMCICIRLRLFDSNTLLARWCCRPIRTDTFNDIHASYKKTPIIQYSPNCLRYSSRSKTLSPMHTAEIVFHLVHLLTRAPHRNDRILYIQYICVILSMSMIARHTDPTKSIESTQ